MDFRAKYRNPSPPPGYVRGPPPRLVLKPGLEEIDGEAFKFLSLVIESGILDDSDPSSDFNIQTSEDEVKIIPVAPKVPPVIDLDVECLELSDGEIPSTPEAPPVSKADICVKKPSAKVKGTSSSLKQLQAVLPQPVKVKKHRLKKEKVVEYSSDSSSNESYKKQKRRIHIQEKTKRKHHSRSPSSERNEDVDREDHKYNPTQVKQEENLFGQYFCEVCKLAMNAKGSYDSHLIGKRHLKAVRAQKHNIAQSVENSLNSNAFKPSRTRYPKPPPNIDRIIVREISLIQSVVEERAPCPALRKVIEIQGLDEIHYYCELCDAPCSSNSIIPHLRGRKHLLMCLSFYDERTYDGIKNKSNRKELDSLLNKLLTNIKKIHGLGYITVEKEIERNDYQDPYISHGGRVIRREEIPGPSHRHDYPEDRLPETFEETMIPDTSKADFYCRICDSHMNNINMWEAHVRGKRHLKNVKKDPGEGPSKTRSHPMPGKRAMIMDALDVLREPVVGLDFIREIQNPEVRGASYNCFLCGACLTSMDIVDHILSQKHRTKFLEKINNDEWQTINQMNIQGSRLGSLIAEACENDETKNGRGVIEVHVTKSAVRW